jgi:hypothetical protein
MIKMLLLEIGPYFILNLVEVAEMINLLMILLIISDNVVNKLVLRLKNPNIFHLTQRTGKLEFQDLYKITADNKEIEEKLLLSVL